MMDNDGFVRTGHGGDGARRWRPVPEPEAWRLGRAILDVLFRHRRARHGDPCGGCPCETCFAPHMAAVVRSVTQGEAVHLVLPGFPAKAPNLEKVLGILPDMAERLSLAYLDEICGEIRAIYPPGARMTICSDGRVFADLVGVPDDYVDAYAREIRAIIRSLGAWTLSHVDLDEILGLADEPEAVRLALASRYGDPAERVRERVLADPSLSAMFNGLHRFLFEDLVVRSHGRSRNAVRNACKQTAYEMIGRGMAWSTLLRERFAGAVRLSIHPHACHGEKLGVRLIESADSWGTPWHGVAVDVGGRFRLMKRSEAEGLHAELVYRDGHPSHYVAQGVTTAQGLAAGTSAA